MSQCSKYHILISCLVDGEVTFTERRELEEHFRTCDHCLARYNKYKQISTIVESIYDNKQVPEVHTTTTAADDFIKRFFNVYRALALPGFAAFLLVVLATLLITTPPSGKSPLVAEFSTSLMNLPLSTFSCFDSTIAESNQSRLSCIENSYETEETGNTTFPVYESPLFNDKLSENVNFYQSSQLFLE
ncbi:MAG TPA: anti-sigma factor [Chitinispirillaceae bacterium]|nr:anti-sigma factor [Chitinispirillaceae bacterium]